MAGGDGGAAGRRAGGGGGVGVLPAQDRAYWNSELNKPATREIPRHAQSSPQRRPA